MKKYIPSQIEPKWQEKWRAEKLYLTDLSNTEKKYYCLVELPYTSGDLHMGHWFTFTMGDILARLKKRQGFNVLFPNGFDAFGLPAENAAIKQGIHPRDWTYQNIKRMKEQFETLGVSIDWEKTATTADPEYYRWNQWIFLKMFERGIAYRGKAISNWCPSCKTVLADENVEAGRCWRCNSEVIQKEVEQWFLKLTAYADRLLWQDPPQADWPKPLRVAQNDWIGKSQGINITYSVIATPPGRGKQSSSEREIAASVEDSLLAMTKGGKIASSKTPRNDDVTITCFTTRPDTNFGATFIVLAPEHPLALELADAKQKAQVQEYITQASKKSEVERKENRDKTGVFTGSVAINGLNSEKMPVWIADYVLMGYGTGAVVGVPGHDIRDFEFANKFDLPIKRVVVGKDGDTSAITQSSQVQEEEGRMINSSFLDGMDIHEATQKIMDYLEEKGWGKRVTIYHLHDWSISRQRYWGTPIPMIHCGKCGIVPVPEENLPVELPYEVDYKPQGKPPLATAEEWMKVKCPKCGGEAKRDTETMDGFVDNSWYFYRYLDSKNDKEIFDKKLIERWMPLDIYIGGAEHTVGHTLYSRFFTKFFHDLGLVNFDEYSKKRVHHGVILGPDGSRMSKSRGNVVNPDEEVKRYGADAIRLYLMFLGPFDIVTPWNPDGVNGIYHFLQRVWGFQEKIKSQRVKESKSQSTSDSSDSSEPKANDDSLTQEDLRIMHRTIKKVSEDIEQLKFNTAIASLMEWLNYLSRKDTVSVEEYGIYLKLLAPFAPHITEELWQILHCHPEERSDEGSLANASSSNESSTLRLRPDGLRDSSPVSPGQNDNDWSIHQQSWPESDKKYLEEEEYSIAVQINGKVRDILLTQKDIISNKEVIEKMALESQKVQKFLAGKSVKKVVYIPGKIISFVAS